MAAIETIGQEFSVLHRQCRAVNAPWGFAVDLVEVLWGKHEYGADAVMREIDQRVVAEIGFSCVILARYDFGLVAIDCCDANHWIVNDNRIAFYLKMQFDPRFEYARKVVPFTYIPQKPVPFDASLHRYREEYRTTRKDRLAWGRFIAVSLERFHLAHAMRRQGISGGCYVLCDDGYEDHALDEVSPRRRLPFEQYLAQTNRSIWIIDAAGFGDFTHRLIESFAIGVPVIRPKLVNQTSDPIVAGVHYIDCGERGSRLGEALEVASNPRIRQAIIDNAIEWYQRNGTVESIRRQFAARLLELERQCGAAIALPRIEPDNE